ncbi:MAG: TIGR01777 family oxidoreductase [Parvularculaceae bacterium]|nr:TIGR01777 family oxidoreductase [Parvularculaceae bacterium]
MDNPLLWSLIALQFAFGAFDTLYHHEFTERLPWRLSQQDELKLHGVRNLFYSVIFVTLGFAEPKGAFAITLIAALALEIVVTLWDFVEEDRSRRLPPSERVLHTLLALNYGAILSLLAPVLFRWAGEGTALAPAHYGWLSGMCAAAAIGTTIFGLRDRAASARLARLNPRRAGPLAAGLKAGAHVLVTGATGFIGSRLVAALVEEGVHVTALVRDPKCAMEKLPAPIRLITDIAQIRNDEAIEAVIHLAGEPLADGLWTEKKKARVIDSRAALTGALIAMMGRLNKAPEAFIAASAIGWYGMSGDEPLTEADSACDQSFSHESCAAVEEAARGAEILGVRVVRLRIGLVLDPEGGLLARMLLPFEFGAGAPFGNGRQMMSWISRDDLVRLIVYAIRTPALTGAVNAVAPNAVSNNAFSKALANALARPMLFRIPAAPLRLIAGQFAEELLLGGQNVKPAKAIAAGFVFADADLERALGEMAGREPKVERHAVNLQPAE